MSGLELIHKIVVQNERDFTKIRIPSGFKIEGDEEKALIGHLTEKHKLYCQNPLNFSYACLQGIEARNLLLPWLEAAETDFTGARLMGCQLTYGNFTKAIFTEANLSPGPNKRITSFAFSKLPEANFEKANLRDVYFGGVDLSGSNFRSSYLHSADFTKSTLCLILGLESAIDVEYAKIEAVTVTEKEKKLIIGIRGRQMFSRIINSHLN